MEPPSVMFAESRAWILPTLELTGTGVFVFPIPGKKEVAWAEVAVNGFKTYGALVVPAE